MTIQELIEKINSLLVAIEETTVEQTTSQVYKELQNDNLPNHKE